MKATELFVVPLLALIVRCATSVPTITTVEDFSVSASEYILKEGNLSITGQAFIRKPNGEIMTCAGLEVSLVPATAHQKERMFYLYGSEQFGFDSESKVSFQDVQTLPKYILEKPTHPSWDRMQRLSLCDSDGNFRFDKLVKGDYFVIAPVMWQNPYVKQNTPSVGFGGLIAATLSDSLVNAKLLQESHQGGRYCMLVPLDKEHLELTISGILK